MKPPGIGPVQVTSYEDGVMLIRKGVGDEGGKALEMKQLQPGAKQATERIDCAARTTPEVRMRGHQLMLCDRAMRYPDSIVD